MNNTTHTNDFKRLLLQKEYWEKEFTGEVPILDIPTDYPRSQKVYAQCSITEEKISVEFIEKIRKLAVEINTTEYVIFLAAAMVLLSKYSQQEDIVIGSPVSSLINKDVERTEETFANTLAMRGSPKGEKQIAQFLLEMKEKCLKAYENRDYQFKELVRFVEINENRSNNPIFNVMIIYNHEEMVGINEKEIRVEESLNLLDSSSYNLTFRISAAEESYSLRLEYRTDLFCAETAWRMNNHYLAILKQIVEGKNQRINNIEAITEEERKKILGVFNNTYVKYDRSKTLLDLFEEQVERTPQNIAVVYEEESITYEELNQKANQLARKLQRLGVRSNDFVAMLVPRCIEMFVALYGILKAGGAYVPIDPEYPTERIKYMMEDCNPKVIVVYECSMNADVPVINLGEQKIYSGAATNLEKIIKPEDLIYCTYTSGTTGKPKGIPVRYKNVNNLINWYKGYLHITEKEKVIVISLLTFDLTQRNIFTPHVTGATIYCCGDGRKFDNWKVLNYIRKKKISMISCAASMFYSLLDSSEKSNYSYLMSLRKVILGGETLVYTKIKKFIDINQDVMITNVYGVTEDSGCATAYTIHNESNKVITIGKPLDNKHILICNDNNLCGIGIKGEICIYGEGVTDGYLNKEELTAKKFVKNLYGKGKMYRTGDLGRWLPDGNIEYLGRIDDQVKIRGLRIELGEIESVLRNIACVKDCTVITREDKSGEKAIYAYIVSETNVDMSMLRLVLGRILPKYMIPAYFGQIEKVPVTKNGKIDKRALPELKASTEKVYEAPRNEVEEVVCRIYKENLNIEKVGMNDGFFELGGHSLRAIRVINSIEEKTGVRLDMKDIFDTPTVKGLSSKIIQHTQQNYEGIPEAEERYCYPMSSTQKRIYLLCQMNHVGLAYNIPRVIRLTGEVNPERIRTAMQEMINRHEILRTEFGIYEEELVQWIRKVVQADYVYIEDNQSSEEELIQDFLKPYDLTKAPLFRGRLVKREDNYLLMLDIHHIVSDGMSEAIFTKELNMLYNRKTLNMPRQYKDYSEWMRIRDLSAQKKYWKCVFSGEIPVLDIPTDYKRVQEQSFKGDIVETKLNFRLSAKIRKLAEETGTTEYMVFLSAAMILLSKYSRQEDIVIGSPVSARAHRDTEEMLGMFVNTLAMRGTPDGKKKFNKFLGEIKETCLKAYENQEYPFEELLDSLNITRDRSKNPLFDVMLILQNNEMIDIDLQGAHMEEMQRPNFMSKFDLTFMLSSTEDEYQFVLEYCTDLFCKETVERITRHYKAILEQIVEDKYQKINEIKTITEEEHKKILEEFNNTNVEYDCRKTVVDLFEEQVEKTPEITAVVYENVSITYDELNQRANQVARRLREMDVKPNDFVVVLAKRSIEMLIGIYGILKAGGAYVPIDLKYPEERIHYILQDCSAKAAVVYSCKVRLFIPTVDLKDMNIRKENFKNLSRVNKSSDLVYCLYTSGTTGKPKGVMIKHSSIVNYSIYCKSILHECNSIISVTSLTFDIVVTELIVSILNHKLLILTNNSEQNDQEKVSDLINRNEVDVLQTTPSKMKLYMIDQDKRQYLSRLKVIMLGGEKVPLALCKEISSNTNATIYITYGPTETTVWSSVYRVSEDIRQNLPIGQPIFNTQIYIRDENNLCGIGVPGELYIAGRGLAKGYLNNEALTEKKFVKNPYGEGKMYRTGDLGRWLTDGNIEFLGRIDEQVKIRGIRIELGEIESTLRSIAYVKDCVVITKDDKCENTALYAYIISDTQVNISEVRDTLRRSLPEYMIPVYIAQIEKIPFTLNGKMDKHALPEIIVNAGKEYIASRNEIEEILCNIYKEILDVEKVGINDSFFELGGDSIKAIRIISKMRQLGYDISFEDIHKKYTVKELACVVKKSGHLMSSHAQMTLEVMDDLNDNEINVLNNLFLD